MNNPVDKISIISAIVTFLTFVIFKLYKEQKLKLEDVVIVIIAGGTLPVTIAIIIYPFFPSWIGSIEEMSLQIAILGLVLLYVYTDVIVTKISSDNSNKEPNDTS